uniref:Uncharacterized protein n=1 Tax=Setaria digitata TaxID=48799 RepID=A0A915PR13_9BILA
MTLSLCMQALWCVLRRFKWKDKKPQIFAIARLGLSVKALPVIPICISIQQATLSSPATSTFAVDSVESDFEWRQCGLICSGQVQRSRRHDPVVNMSGGGSAEDGNEPLIEGRAWLEAITPPSS